MKPGLVALLAVVSVSPLACDRYSEWNRGSIELHCEDYAWTPDASAIAIDDYDRHRYVRVSSGRRVNVPYGACATNFAFAFTLSPDGRYAVAWGERRLDMWGHGGGEIVARCVVDFEHGVTRPLGAAAESILSKAGTHARLTSTGFVVGPAFGGITFAQMDGGSETFVRLPPEGDPEAFVDPIVSWGDCHYVATVGNDAVAVCAADSDHPDLIGIARVQFSPPSVLQARVVRVPILVNWWGERHVAVSQDGRTVTLLLQRDGPATLLRIVIDTGAIELTKSFDSVDSVSGLAVSTTNDALLLTYDVREHLRASVIHVAPNGEIVGRMRMDDSADSIAWDGGKSFWISGCMSAERKPVP
jgi:hypothetical protein